MKLIPVGDLACIETVYDGDPKRQRPPFGNYLGLYGIPPAGGYEWHAENGDWGVADSEDEAQREIEKAWSR